MIVNTRVSALPHLPFITDPFGNFVLVPHHLYRLEAGMELDTVFNQKADVVRRPAFVIRSRDNEVYYFRSAGWKQNTLVIARLRLGGWLIEDCIENPDDDMIMKVLRRGKLIVMR